MSLQELLIEVDSLSSEELEALYRHIVQRRTPSYWLLDGASLGNLHDALQTVHQQATEYSDEAIDAEIDAALNEVRRES